MSSSSTSLCLIKAVLYLIFFLDLTLTTFLIDFYFSGSRDLSLFGVSIVSNSIETDSSFFGSSNLTDLEVDSPFLEETFIMASNYFVSVLFMPFLIIDWVFRRS
jgi:hypothetical protein